LRVGLYSLFPTTPPKCRIVRRRNLVLIRMTTTCRKSVGFYVYRSRRYQKMTFFKKLTCMYRPTILQRSVSWLAHCSQGRPWAIAKNCALNSVTIAQAVCRGSSRLSLKSNCSSPEQGTTACFSLPANSIMHWLSIIKKCTTSELKRWLFNEMNQFQTGSFEWTGKSIQIAKQIGQSRIHDYACRWPINIPIILVWCVIVKIKRSWVRLHAVSR